MTRRNSKLLIVTTFVLVLLVAFAVYFQHAEYKRFKRLKMAELETITNFKASQVTDWRNERLADAIHFSASPLYSDAIFRITRFPDARQEIKVGERNEMIRQLRGYADVHIVFGHQTMSISTSNRFSEVPPTILPLIDSCLLTKQIVFSDLIPLSDDSKRYMVAVGPIAQSSQQVFAAVVFYIDPETYLNATLRFKPLGLPSLETCLMGDSVFYSLNKTSVSPENSYLSKVSLGNGGFEEVFAHGVKVMAYARPIGSSRWVVVSQIPIKELRREFMLANIPFVAAIVIFAFLIVMFVSWIYQRSENTVTRKLMQQEQQTLLYLKASEARFRAVIENSNDAILFLDKDGFITYCAPAIKKLLGYLPDELINKHISVLDCDGMATHFNKKFYGMLNTSGVQTKICEFRAKDQKHHWVEISFNNQMGTEFLNVVVVNIRDIQIRKQHEMEIERLLNFQTTILDNAGSAIITTSPEGIITSFNRTAEELLGYSAQELVGVRTPAWFHLEEEIEAQAKYLSDKLQISIAPGFDVFTIEAQLGAPNHYQWTYKRKDGKLFPVNLIVTSLKDSQGEIIGYIGIALDMSGIKSAEEKFSYFYNLSPDMAGISRMSDGLFIDVNNAFLTTLGYGYYDVVGKTSTEINLWEKVDERDHLKGEVYSNEILRNFEGKIRTKNGVLLDVLFSASRFMFANEECILFVVRDISLLKQKERDLQQERSITNSLFDSVPGVIAIFNEKLELVRWNAKAMGQLGYSVDELQTKHALSFVEQGSIESIMSLVESIRTVGFGEIEIPLVQKSGQTKQFYISGTQTEIDGKLYFVIYGIDITERKKENEALRQIEQQFMNIYNLSPDMIGITRIADGRVLTANPAMEQLSGYTFDEFVGKTTKELGWWANPDDRGRMLAKLAQTGEVLNEEFQMGTKFRGVLTCIFSARPIVYENENCILFVVHDITERKKSEMLLRSNQDRLKKAQELGRLGYSEQVLGENKVWISAEGKRIFGFEQVDGFITFDEVVMCIDDRELLFASTRKQIEKGERFDIELRIHTADNGAPKYIHAIQNIELDAVGKPYKLINTFQDITERKAIEMEILRINENLEKIVEERTMQLATVNKDLEAFAYSVSHDLRAPIRHIDGFFKLLYGQIEHPTEAMASYYEKISGASKRMSSMIDDLLSFSRLGRKEMLFIEVDLGVLVKEITESFQTDLGDRSLRWDIHPLPTVIGDKNLLKTAFENIIGNAVKYTKHQNQAIVEIGHEMQPNGLVRIFITDNGVGFDMAYQGKLFGVFQRLHSNEEFDGTGIGLANVKQIVKRHGGDVSAIGQVGKGATFMVDLPMPPMGN